MLKHNDNHHLNFKKKNHPKINQSRFRQIQRRRLLYRQFLKTEIELIN